MEKSTFAPLPPDESLDVDAAEAGSALSSADLKVRRKIDELADLTKEPNWDDERGLAIAKSEWDSAWEFYLRLRARGVPPPFIAPCGDTSIHFHWFDKSQNRFNLEMKGAYYFWSQWNADGSEIPSERCDSLPALEVRVLKFFGKAHSDVA